MAHIRENAQLSCDNRRSTGWTWVLLWLSEKCEIFNVIKWCWQNRASQQTALYAVLLVYPILLQHMFITDSYSCGNLFMRYTFLFPVIKLVMVWAWVVAVRALKNKSNLKTKSSFFSDQSMFNMSEWIAAEWWNRLQTNTKPLCTEQFAYRAHNVSINPAELREHSHGSPYQRPAIISVVHYCGPPYIYYIY